MATRRDQAKSLLDEALPAGTEVHSRTQEARFQLLTNTPHDTLKANWKKGGIMTACNGFVGWYAGRMGIKGIDSYFNLESELARLGKSHAWMPSDGCRKPQYGDILHHTQGGTGLHVDVCIGFTKDGRLMRAAAGQTLFKSPRNPEAETDVIKRVTGTGPFNFRNLVGWLDLEKFFLSTPAADERENFNWAMGWWDVRDANQYYYYFDTAGHVQYTKTRPTAKFAPPRIPLNAGIYEVRRNNVIFIRWNALTDGSTEETFQAGPDRRAMTGKSRYGPLVANRI